MVFCFLYPQLSEGEPIRGGDWLQRDSTTFEVTLSKRKDSGELFHYVQRGAWLFADNTNYHHAEPAIVVGPKQGQVPSFQPAPVL